MRLKRETEVTRIKGKAYSKRRKGQQKCGRNELTEKISREIEREREQGERSGKGTEI